MDRDDKPEAEDQGATPDQASKEGGSDSDAPEASAAAEQEDRPEPDDAALDLESRILCPDGACIGVIGADGRCKVCGRSAAIESSASAPAAPRAADAGDDAEPPAAADDSSDLDLASRKLCSDGACIGVIGADGRCKICHKPYTGDPE